MGRTKMSTKGFPARNRCGLSSNSRALFFKLLPSVFLPLAFSMMPLSIMVMIGATSAPAAPAASASLPRRRPSLLVFHLWEPVFAPSFAVVIVGSWLGLVVDVDVDSFDSNSFKMPGSFLMAMLIRFFCSCFSPTAASSNV